MKKELLVGIYKDVNDGFPPNLHRFESILRYNGISVLRMSADEDGFWENAAKLDYFIFNFAHFSSEIQTAQTILPVIENELLIPCLPNRSTCWHYDDKIAQYYIGRAHNFPFVETWIFYHKKYAMKWLETADFPLVFKLKGGAGSRNTIGVYSKQQAIKLTKKMFAKGVYSDKIPSKDTFYRVQKLLNIMKLRKLVAYKRGRITYEEIDPCWQKQRGYVLFQRFLPNNKFDIRVNILGDKAFCFIRYVRPNDFRASGSGLIDYDVKKIDRRCITIAFDISKKMNFQSMAYDFIFDEEKNPKIAEMSYTFVDDAVYQCPGYFDSTLKWHDGHYWPQYSQLQHFIKEVSLQQPENTLMAGKV